MTRPPYGGRRCGINCRWTHAAPGWAGLTADAAGSTMARQSRGSRKRERKHAGNRRLGLVRAGHLSRGYHGDRCMDRAQGERHLGLLHRGAPVRQDIHGVLRLRRGHERQPGGGRGVKDLLEWAVGHLVPVAVAVRDTLLLAHRALLPAYARADHGRLLRVPLRRRHGRPLLGGGRAPAHGEHRHHALRVVGGHPRADGRADPAGHGHPCHDRALRGLRRRGGARRRHRDGPHPGYSNHPAVLHDSPLRTPGGGRILGPAREDHGPAHVLARRPGRD